MHGKSASTPWVWREGRVDPTGAHLGIFYGEWGESAVLAAQVSKPVGNAFVVEFVAIPKLIESEYEQVKLSVEKDLNFVLLEIGGSDPWNYAIYHCGTGANMYGDVHWSYFPAPAAAKAMKQYLEKPAGSSGMTPVQQSAKLDNKRADLIETELKPLVERYLAGEVLLEAFKQAIDGNNKRYKLWGFNGPNGQMNFNRIVSIASDDSECDKELRAAISVPEGEEEARIQMGRFEDYVCRIRKAYEKKEGTKRGCPKIGSIPFFLSYFWQIQNRRTWPIYYTNAVNSMVDLNLLHLGKSHAENYIGFKHLCEELKADFTSLSGKSFDLYGVEHVFWTTGSHPLDD